MVDISRQTAYIIGLVVGLFIVVFLYLYFAYPIMSAFSTSDFGVLI